MVSLKARRKRNRGLIIGQFAHEKSKEVLKRNNETWRDEHTLTTVNLGKAKHLFLIIVKPA